MGKWVLIGDNKVYPAIDKMCPYAHRGNTSESCINYVANLKNVSKNNFRLVKCFQDGSQLNYYYCDKLDKILPGHEGFCLS